MAGLNLGNMPYVIFCHKTGEYFRYYDINKGVVATTTEAKQAMVVKRQNQDKADQFAKYIRGKDQLDRFWQAELSSKHLPAPSNDKAKQGGLW